MVVANMVLIEAFGLTSTVTPVTPVCEPNNGRDQVGHVVLETLIYIRFATLAQDDSYFSLLFNVDARNVNHDRPTFDSQRGRMGLP